MTLHHEHLLWPERRRKVYRRRAFIISLSGMGLAAGLAALQSGNGLLVQAQRQNTSVEFTYKGTHVRIEKSNGDVARTAHMHGGARDATIIVNNDRRMAAMTLHLHLFGHEEFVSAEKTIRKALDKAVTTELVLGRGSLKNRKAKVTR
jgi:hypothetical protein